jgi:DNA-binding IclR family transcriptional regulator
VGNAKPIRDDILEAMSEHPLLSRRQLELYLGRPERTVRQGLLELKARGWVQRLDARQPWMHTRSLFSLTQAGAEELARRANVPLAEYGAQTGLASERLGRLVLTIERVFQLRTFFLWLAPPGTAYANSQPKARIASESEQWRAVRWDVEVGKLFSAKGRAVWIPFHGAALMRRDLESKDGRWAFVVVEFDLSRVPVERDRERLHQFVAAQDDPRYWGKDKEQFFPVLLVIAQDELRLQDYYNVLRSAALARQLPMPRAYLTTFSAMLSLRDDRTLPIWYSTISGQRTSLLFDTEGVATSLPDQLPWRQMPLNSQGVVPNLPKDALVPAGDEANSGVTLAPHPFRSAGVTPELFMSNRGTREGATFLAQIALNLQPLEKRILDEIAAHPLLTRDEIVLLLQATRRRVQPGLAKMTALKLIEAHDGRYLIAPKGQKYLALAAGFGNAVQRYARARGWGKGFGALMRHWEHTQEENKFFLHLAEVAQERGHTLTWLSELESRLYYEAGQRRHSFLPDGRGTYLARDARFEFALEIDRSGSSQKRFRRKLAEYEACIGSNVLRSEGIELLRVLVVTKSWERAESWRRAAESVQVQFPIFITTFDRLYASGADAPIWWRIDLPTAPETAAASPKQHCFECFVHSSSVLRPLSKQDD